MAQELNLTPAQKDSLAKFVAWNAQPENRFYHYDYFRDNCSTRVRDALDRVLGGVIKRATENVASGTTYRSHTRRLTQDAPWVYLGTLLGLGRPVDRPISRWEEMFLPVRLHNDLRGIRVKDASGASVPLIKNDTALFVSSRPPEALEPRSHLAIYCGRRTTDCLCRDPASVSRGSRQQPDAATVGRLRGPLASRGWTRRDGSGGAVAFHQSRLQLSEREPFAGESPFARCRRDDSCRAHAARHERKRSDREAMDVETRMDVVAGIAFAGFVLKLLPSFYQVNGEIIALTLPAHVGVALSLRRRILFPIRTRRRRASAH